MPNSWHLRATVLLALALHLGLAVARPAAAAGNSTADSNDGDTHLYCEKTTWYDVCWFFFTNYLLHALSVRSLPGENVYSSTVFKLCCLLVPYTGVRRGLALVSRASSLARNDLQAAARAGALCMVIRKPDWRPEDDQTVHGCHVNIVHDAPERGVLNEDSKASEKAIYENSEARPTDGDDASSIKQSEVHLNVKDPVDPPAPSGVLDRLATLLIRSDRFNTDSPSDSPVDHESLRIHGAIKLTPGYGLSYVPPDVKVYPRHCDESSSTEISKTRLASTHDIPRILFSLIQTVSGGYSLYKARGSQIDRYGFAAFGLTVLPYVIVSIINFIGSLLSAEYETLYLVHSSTLEEMLKRGGAADGVVGSLHEDPQDERVLSWRSGTDILSQDNTSIAFSSAHERLCGYETRNGDKARDFVILPYEPPKPCIERRWRRIRYRYRQWHGLLWPIRPKQELAPSCSTINVPSHASIIRLPPPAYQPYLNALTISLLALSLSLPYIVISFLTHWKANSSTSVQRNFVLIWLISGQAQGYVVSKVETLTGKKSSLRGLIIIFLTYGSNCLCGLTIVAQEMLEFGTCKAV